MVEIFKTNVQCTGQAQQIIQSIVESFPFIKVNFDLDDCDKILRAEGTNIPLAGIVAILNSLGFSCVLLD